MDIIFSSKSLKLNILFTIVLALFLTACGGSGSGSLTAKEKAIKIITAYARDGSNPAPTLQNYLDAAVTGVTAENLDKLNEVVDNLKEADVDTTAELNALTTQLGINHTPTANAGADISVVEGESIALNGSGTVIQIKY